jgi:hypothetical protein
VVKDGKETKIWLNDVNVAINLGYSARELSARSQDARATHGLSGGME